MDGETGHAKIFMTLESVYCLTATPLLWIGLFLAMLAGMIAKVYYDYAVKNTSPPRLELALLGRPEIVIPIVISPMIFGGIYGLLRDSPKNLGAFTLAFQNGFFWKTVFSGLDASAPYHP